MLLKFVDRTWILLNRLIEKGEKEGTVRCIEIPVKEWKLLQSEFAHLNKDEQNQKIKDLTLEKDGMTQIRPHLVMDDDFVNRWIAEGHDVYYKGIHLVLPPPEPVKEEKAVGTTELNTHTNK
jgi:hypothetical protein